MSGKAQRPPEGVSWVWLTIDLMQSPAWRDLSINGRRFVDFLLVEHMRRRGKHNGELLAPRRQLEAAGIGARHVSAAIEEVERHGLADCKRGFGRRPSVYALTFLPLADDAAPSNRWRSYRPEMTSEGKSLQMTSEGKHLRYPKGSHKARSDFRREVTKPRNKGIRREAPI